MKILVLHNVEDLRRARRSTLEYIFAFERYQPGHAFWYQRISDPPSQVVRETSWDAVILESTSLGVCTVRPRELFFQIKEMWSFLADDAIVKVVFPQDDANHGGLMDDWFAEWGVHHVFSVRAREHWGVLYPKTTAIAAFHECLPGYIDDLALQRVKVASRPWAERSRLLGQRVTMYPARGGRQGRLKGVVAEQVKAAATRLGLSGVDISTDHADTLYGEAWYDFLGDCKFVLGGEGGLSINDPYGEISDRIDAWCSDHPDATFEEIETACFSGLDGLHVFTGFTPRIFEAAICGASQVLVEGQYLGVLEPGVHYLPLRADVSNVEDVFEQMRDERAAKARVVACRATLIDGPRFRYRTLADRVISAIASSSVSRANSGEPLRVGAAMSSYAAVLAEREQVTGFSWPELGERVALLATAQIASLSEPDELATALTGHLAYLDAFVTATKFAAAEHSDLSAVIRTMHRAAAHVRDLARYAAEVGEAADVLPHLANLRLELAGVSLTALARLYSARAVVVAAAEGGDAGRLLVALAEAGRSVAGLASRLAPAEGQRFTEAELARLQRLDQLLVVAGADGGVGLAGLERFQRYGARANTLMDLLEAGGDLPRLVAALQTAGPAVAGIVSRLLPSAETYSAEELIWLEQVDRILIRSERRTERLDALENLQQQPPRA